MSSLALLLLPLLMRMPLHQHCMHVLQVSSPAAVLALSVHCMLSSQGAGVGAAGS